MSLGHLISARTMGKIDINFSDSEEEQSGINEQLEFNSHEIEKGRLDEQKKIFLKYEQKKKPEQVFSFNEYRSSENNHSLNSNRDKSFFLQTLKDHYKTYNNVSNNRSISNSKKFLLKRPFIKQMQEKEDNNFSNKTKMSSEWMSRVKELIRQKKRIQFLNCSAVVQDLQQIKLNHCLRRSDTAATETDSVGKVRQNLLQAMAKDQIETKLEYKEKEKQNTARNVEQNQHYQVQAQESSSYRNQETVSDGVESQHQMDNLKLTFKMPTTKFHNIKQLEFDSESEDEVQNQSQQEGQMQVKQPSDHSANQEEKHSLFSEEFRTKKYLQMRADFFNILLGKKSPITSEVELCSKPSSSGFPQLQKLRYGQNVKRLLTTEIPFNNMFQFQVHVYKDLFKTQYQLWTREGCSLGPDMEQKILLAAACNQSFQIDKSTFIMEQVDPNNQRKFIGQLESNFLRDFYVLHGYRAQKQSKLDDFKDSVMRLQTKCDSIQEIMNVSLNINRTVYVPNLYAYQQRARRVPFNSPISSNKPSNLKELYQEDRFDHNFNPNRVSKLVNSKTCNFDIGFYSKFGIRKSNKTLLMTNSRKSNHALFIGKIASKKYKLMVGEGISPIQALGILITHVENN